MFENVRRIAVVGVAKNCGKTTTMNALVAHSRATGHTVGLMSVGVDGETSDVLIGTPKPPIVVDEGDWIATAEKAIEASSAGVEFVENLGIDTPLGSVVIARIVEPGAVILAGLRHRADFVYAAEKLESYGVEKVFVDGAYGRIAGAHGDVTDGVVVSTGAVISPRLDRVVDATRSLVGRLARPPVAEPWARALLSRAVDEGRVLLGGPQIDPIALPSRSALVGLPSARALWNDQVQGVAIPGLVSNRVVEELLHPEGDTRVLLVPDPTVLQADARFMRRLERRWRVQSAQSNRVLALAINPTSIQGHSIDEAEFRRSLHEIWPEITIVNPQDDIDSQQES